MMNAVPATRHGISASSEATTLASNGISAFSVLLSEQHLIVIYLLKHLN